MHLESIDPAALDKLAKEFRDRTMAAFREGDYEGAYANLNLFSGMAGVIERVARLQLVLTQQTSMMEIMDKLVQIEEGITRKRN